MSGADLAHFPTAAARADPDELLVELEDDARVLASIALGALREARFGDVEALREAIKIARRQVIEMAKTFNRLEGALGLGS